MIEVGKTYGSDIQIRIDDYDESEVITATVTYISDFWKTPYRTKIDMKEGMKVTLQKPKGADWWNPTDPSGFPWYMLYESGSFEHYRA